MSIIEFFDRSAQIMALVATGVILLFIGCLLVAAVVELWLKIGRLILPLMLAAVSAVLIAVPIINALPMDRVSVCMLIGGLGMAIAFCAYAALRQAR